MLEQIIIEHLRADIQLASYLAVYDGQPAIFNRKKPLDADPKWDSTSERNCIILFLDFREDAGRRAASTLKVEIICSNEQQSTVDIGQLMKK